MWRCATTKAKLVKFVENRETYQNRVPHSQTTSGSFNIRTWIALSHPLPGHHLTFLLSYRMWKLTTKFGYHTTTKALATNRLYFFNMVDSFSNILEIVNSSSCIVQSRCGQEITKDMRTMLEGRLYRSHVHHQWKHIDSLSSILCKNGDHKWFGSFESQEIGQDIWYTRISPQGLIQRSKNLSSRKSFGVPFWDCEGLQCQQFGRVFLPLHHKISQWADLSSIS